MNSLGCVALPALYHSLKPKLRVYRYLSEPLIQQVRDIMWETNWLVLYHFGYQKIRRLLGAAAELLARVLKLLCRQFQVKRSEDGPRKPPIAAGHCSLAGQPRRRGQAQAVGQGLLRAIAGRVVSLAIKRLHPARRVYGLAAAGVRVRYALPQRGC